MSKDEDKIGLIDMIRWAEIEAEGVDRWRRVLTSEGERIDPGVMRRGLIARRAMETLELVLEHKEEFVAMVQLRQKEKRRVAAEAVTSRSTEPSSGPSTSTTPPSGSTDP